MKISDFSMKLGSPKQLLTKIAQTIFDKKGKNIIALDVRGICTLTDYFVIAEGTSDRHVRALAKDIVEELQKQKLKPIHVEGDLTGDWVVLDYGDFMVHLFLPELREKYALEELWHDGKIVDLDIKIPQS